MTEGRRNSGEAEPSPACKILEFMTFDLVVWLTPFSSPEFLPKDLSPKSLDPQS